MSQAVICITPTKMQANRIVEALHSAGFTSEKISMLLPDESGSEDMGHNNSTKAPEGASAGIGTGAVLGGALGLLAGIGALAIPGLGPFIAAGPIMTALSGAAIGGTIGGVTGALIGLGIPEYEAKQYEGKLKDGNILLSVHTENPGEVENVIGIFETNRAEAIGRSTEAKVT
jgi:hypothetical protein